MTTDEATKREATFKRGEQFINHTTSVDALYTAVMADIAKSSFEGVGWNIDQVTVFRHNSIYVPSAFPITDPLPKWLISKFDNSQGAKDPSGYALKVIRQSTKEKEVSNVQYAWDEDDQLAYIDGVASAVFLQ